MVQALARYCLSRQRRVAVLLRGYRRRSRGTVVVSRGNGPEVPWWESGDEAWLHAWKIPQALVIVDRCRERAAQIARDLGAHIAILDDGFQYRRLRRHLDVVLLDRRSLRCRFAIPFGCLREPLRALRRADLLLLTDLSVGELPPSLRHQPWVAVRFTLEHALLWTPEGAQPLAAPLPEPVAAFAGIARAERFRALLHASGWQLAFWKPFPDHHPYSWRNLQALLRRCHRLGIQYLVTTEKDLVRLLPYLGTLPRWGVGLISISLTASFGVGASRLWECLERLLQQDSSVLENRAQHLEG